MPVADKKAWEKWEKSNPDPYGKCCVDVAREVMRSIDEEAPEVIDARQLVHAANRKMDAGLTLFMAGTVARMVSHCHSRGQEFRRSWNLETQLGDEGARANEGEGVLNPAVLNVG